MQILLSRSPAGPGRTVKQEQERISRNHVQTFISPSVLILDLMRGVYVIVEPWISVSTEMSVGAPIYLSLPPPSFLPPSLSAMEKGVSLLTTCSSSSWRLSSHSFPTSPPFLPPREFSIRRWKGGTRRTHAVNRICRVCDNRASFNLRMRGTITPLHEVQWVRSTMNDGCEVRTKHVAASRNRTKNKRKVD